MKRTFFVLSALTLAVAASFLWRHETPPVVISDSLSVELTEMADWPQPKSIFLRIPREYMSRFDPAVGKAKGLNLFAYYPDFSSASNPKNADYRAKCIGYCNGRLLISFENRGLHEGYHDAVSAMAAIFLRPPPVYEAIKNRPAPVTDVVDHEPQFGFDKVFDHAHHPSGSVDRFFLKSSGEGRNYDVVAECDLTRQVPQCILHFTPKCEPALDVQLHVWQYSRMTDALDVAQRAETFVSSLLQNEKCKI